MGPALPDVQGPLSAAILELLTGRRAAVASFPASDADPYGLNLHLALYVCYELAYRGFAAVDPDWACNPELLRPQALLERHFIETVRSEVGGIRPDDTVRRQVQIATMKRSESTTLPSGCFDVHRALHQHRPR